MNVDQYTTYKGIKNKFQKGWLHKYLCLVATAYTQCKIQAVYLHIPGKETQVKQRKLKYSMLTAQVFLLLKMSWK